MEGKIHKCKNLLSTNNKRINNPTSLNKLRYKQKLEPIKYLRRTSLHIPIKECIRHSPTASLPESLSAHPNNSSDPSIAMRTSFNHVAGILQSLIHFMLLGYKLLLFFFGVMVDSADRVTGMKLSTESEIFVWNQINHSGIYEGKLRNNTP